jgi:ubiquinone/menaquinone biosynthesis C-methylase UbiE
VTIRKHLYQFSFALQRVIAPGVVYSQNTYERVLYSRVKGVGSWLDMGCGHQLLPEWRKEAEIKLLKLSSEVIGVDLDVRSLKQHRSFTSLVCADAASLPFRERQFDLVTANMVVEHLEVPEIQFREIERILKSGGRFVFHTPNERSYIVWCSKLLPDRVKRILVRILEGRGAEDVFPTYYRANTVAKIKELCDTTGLELEDVELIRNTPLFNFVPPLLLIELLWLRALALPRLANLRTNIICTLRKPHANREVSSNS